MEVQNHNWTVVYKLPNIAETTVTVATEQGVIQTVQSNKDNFSAKVSAPNMAQAISAVGYTIPGADVILAYKVDDHGRLETNLSTSKTKSNEPLVSSEAGQPSNLSITTTVPYTTSSTD